MNAETIRNLLSAVVQILILAAGLYYLLLFLRGTRARQALTGLFVLFLALIGISQVLNLAEIGYILEKFFPTLPVAIVIIFHPEIRRAILEFGQRSSSISSTVAETVDAIVHSVEFLSKRRYGALIAIERHSQLREYQRQGCELNAPVVAALLNTIFFPKTALHDGGVIIRGSTILAASCIFPLTIRRLENSSLGTRHRAGIGLSEETDALVIIVSEETGTVSIAYRGELARDIRPEHLREILTQTFVRESKSKKLKGSALPNTPSSARQDALADPIDALAAAISGEKASAETAGAAALKSADSDSESGAKKGA